MNFLDYVDDIQESMLEQDTSHDQELNISKPDVSHMGHGSMGMAINKIILSGAIDAEPKIINTQNGTQGVSLSLSVRKATKDKETDTIKEYNSWYNLITYEQHLVDIASKLEKGQEVVVRGQLNVRSWSDQTGKKRLRYEVMIEELFDCTQADSKLNEIGDMSATAKASGASINVLVLSGILDSPPKIINTQNGTQGISLSLAMKKISKNRETGEVKEYTSWYNLISYNAVIVSMSNKLKQGQEVLIQGSINVRNWTDQMGEKNTRYEVVMDKLTILQSKLSSMSFDITDHEIVDDELPF